MSKKSTQVLIKSVMISEARGKFKKCQICQKEFGIFQKEHQCKRYVGLFVRCANHHGPVLGDAGFSKQTHRICNTCKEESESIKKFIEQFKIGLGKDGHCQKGIRICLKRKLQSKRQRRIHEVEIRITIGNDRLLDQSKIFFEGIFVLFIEGSRIRSITITNMSSFWEPFYSNIQKQDMALTKLNLQYFYSVSVLKPQHSQSQPYCTQKLFLLIYTD